MRSRIPAGRGMLVSTCVAVFAASAVAHGASTPTITLAQRTKLTHDGRLPLALTDPTFSGTVAIKVKARDRSPFGRTIHVRYGHAVTAHLVVPAATLRQFRRRHHSLVQVTLRLSPNTGPSRSMKRGVDVQG